MPIGSSQNITLPTQGGNTDTWGTDLNTELQKLINSVEAQVPGSAIDYSATLDVNEQGVENIEYLEFVTGGGSGGGARSLYMDTSGNLVYVDGAGNSITLTDGGTLNASGIGGINDSGGTYGTSDIEVDWNGTHYDFKNGASTYAPIRVDDVRYFDNTYFITVQAPALSASYSITWPDAAPSASRPLVMSTGGVISAAAEIDVEGQVYHGEEEHHLSLINFIEESGSSWTFGDGSGTAAPTWSYDGSDTDAYIITDVLPLKTTDRIKQVDVDISNVSHDGVCVVTLYAGSTSLGTASSSGTSDQTVTLGSLTRRVATADDHFWLKIARYSTAGGGRTMIVEKVKLTVDRTKP